MRSRVMSMLLIVFMMSALSVPSSAIPIHAPSAEPSVPGSNFFGAMDPLFLQTEPRTGGVGNITFNDNTTTGVDLQLRGNDGVHDEAFAPRAFFGWRWAFATGARLGAQARFMDLQDAISQPARLTPGTTALQNFSTELETSEFDLYTGDIEAAAAYSLWGATLEGTYGLRSARFNVESWIGVFGVFTSGNFVNLQLSNGSAFEGDGHVKGYSLSYRLPWAPVSLFVGRRTSRLEGESDSFARVVGSVASSPNPPLVGAATVTRNNVTTSELEIGETRYGLQADFGAPGQRFRPFGRLSYERMEWAIHGPPTGGAGFGGTIGNLTTNSFVSAGLGGTRLDGWALALGMVF